MSYTPTPTGNGKYRIKVLDQDLYVQGELVHNAGLRLCPLNTTEENQQWIINAVSGKSGTWTITSAADQSKGLATFRAAEQYRGFGYPLPQATTSLNWVITEKSTDGKSYSKLKVAGESYVWDSNWGDKAVNFYYEKSSVNAAPNQCYVFEKLPNSRAPPLTGRALDILFVQDVTGSQGPYIKKAKDNINAICQTLISFGQIAPSALRFGLVIFRDHPPQDTSLVSKSYPFTSDANAFLNNLNDLKAAGGGDGPEAQCEAFAEIVGAGWNDNAEKVALLITDSPPHGIGEDGDRFPNGCPLQRPNDPVVLGRRIARRGIVLNVLACEPTLSGYYKHALDFYRGITKMSGGQVYPLGNVRSTADTILAALLESFNLSIFAKLHIANARACSAPNINEDQLCKLLHGTGTHIHTCIADSYYEDCAQGDANIQAWYIATTLEEGRGNVKEVVGNRIKAQYRNGGAPQIKIETRPISLAQAARAARMVLARSMT